MDWGVENVLDQGYSKFGGGSRVGGMGQDSGCISPCMEHNQIHLFNAKLSGVSRQTMGEAIVGRGGESQ